MKKIYTISVFLFLLNQAFSQVAIEWQKTYGGSSVDYPRIVKPTIDGGYIIAGRSQSNDGDIVSNNHGNEDIWLIKLNDEGNLEWEKSLGGSATEIEGDIIQKQDLGFLLLGSSSSIDGDLTFNMGSFDGWLVSLDSLGNIQWQKVFGGSQGDNFTKIIETNDGGYLLTGYTQSNDGDVSFNHGNIDIWLVKINNTGIIEWEKSYGGSNNDYCYDAKSTSDGGFVIAGNSMSNDGDVTVNYGLNDFWVFKIDSLGNILWEKSYGGSATESINSIFIENNDDIILLGYTSSSDGQISINNGLHDVWMIKIDSLGGVIWEKSYGGSLIDIGSSFIQFNDKYIILATTLSNDGNISQNLGTYDIWIIETDNDGTLIDEMCLGGSNSEQAGYITKVSNDKIVAVAGAISNDIYLDENKGLADYWIIKLTNNFNTISGKIFADLNGNSVKDSNENYISNHAVYEMNSERSGFSNSSGTYNVLVLDSGNYFAYSQTLLNYIPAPAQHNVYFSGINQTDSLKDFAFQPLGVFNDLQITISPVGPFRPGFDAHYNIHYKNVGTTSLQGTIKFYPDPVLTYVSSSLTPQSITNDSIIWQTPLLNPFDEGDIFVTLNVDPSTPIGYWVDSWAKIEPVNGDANPSDNVASWRIQTTGSFDPNDILVNRDSILITELVNPPYLEYLTRFQNTGNDTAFTVKVMNNITEMLDVSTFEFVNSSHPLEINYGNHSRLFEFKFENILLPDSSTNELLSHGFVRYRIKPFDTLSVGDLIKNTAAIYFDFNAPVITNTAVTEIVLPSFVPTIKEEFNFSLYPNPTTGELNISFTLKETSHVKIELFNSLGQAVKTIADKKLNSGENKINFFTENIPKGIYHLKFSVDGNVVAKKVVKM